MRPELTALLNLARRDLEHLVVGDWEQAERIVGEYDTAFDALESSVESRALGTSERAQLVQLDQLNTERLLLRSQLAAEARQVIGKLDESRQLLNYGPSSQQRSPRYFDEAA